MTLIQNYKFVKFCPETEICSYFYEIWDSQQMEYANYEYYNRQYLQRSLNYCLKRIIGSEWF